MLAAEGAEGPMASLSSESERPISSSFVACGRATLLRACFAGGDAAASWSGLRLRFVSSVGSCGPMDDMMDASS